MSTSGDTAHTDTDCGKLLPSEEQTQAAPTDVGGLKHSKVVHGMTCEILAIGGDHREAAEARRADPPRLERCATIISPKTVTSRTSANPFDRADCVGARQRMEQGLPWKILPHGVRTREVCY